MSGPAWGRAAGSGLRSKAPGGPPEGGQVRAAEVLPFSKVDDAGLASSDPEAKPDWVRIPSELLPGASLVPQTVESACKAGDMDSVLWSGRSPGEGNGYPLQRSCLENPRDRGAWWAYGP